MNTSKQVNIMLMLMFLVVLALGLYFVWDRNVREETAAERQLDEAVERGAFLFARNCRVCHGTQGGGITENPNLPAPPLNLPDKRDPEKLQEIQARFRGTIVCGRVGTLMPAWHVVEGGPLNDFQIEQLLALINGALLVGQEGEIIPGETFDPRPDPEEKARLVNAVSEGGWELAVEFAQEADREAVGEKFLAQAISASDTVLVLNDVSGLAADTLLRIEVEFLLIDGVPVPNDRSEVVLVRKVPAASELAVAVLAGDTSIEVKDASAFRPGMTIVVDEEHLRVTTVVGNEMTVERGVEGTKAAYHKPGSAVADTSTEIVVERAAFATEASDHAGGAPVFAGPIEPPQGPLTGEVEPIPCGQLPPRPAPAPAGPPAPTPSPGQPERPATAQAVVGEFTQPTDGVIATETEDNSFTLNNFKVDIGEEVTIRVTNTGQALHNLRIAGPDGLWFTDDDFAVPLDGSFLAGGDTAEGTFRFDQETTLVFRCDVHPLEMWGQITVRGP